MAFERIGEKNEDKDKEEVDLTGELNELSGDGVAPKRPEPLTRAAEEQRRQAERRQSLGGEGYMPENEKGEGVPKIDHEVGEGSFEEKSNGDGK